MMPVMGQRADIAAVVLAAGFSRRMGGTNKLLRPLGGKPLVSHVLETVAGVELGQLIVVLGESGDAIAPLLPASAVPVRNSRAAEGMGASLAVGAAALDPGLAGAFVVLGDMPFVEPADYQRLATAFHQQNGDAICVPMHQGKRGHPVLFPARCFPDLAALRGDEGARGLFAAQGQRIQMVEGCSIGILTDFDDPQSFVAFEASPSGDG